MATLSPVPSRARFFLGFATLASLTAVPGCQELLGIDPWDSASGGAASTSDAITASSSGADASSTSTGATCGMDCMGGECVDGACLPHRVFVEDIQGGHIATLGSDVIVARMPLSGANATVSRMAKDASHEATVYDANDKLVQAIATSPSGQHVFWAGSKTIHRLDSNGTDNVLTTSAGQNAAIEVSAMVPAKLDGGAPQICFVNAKSGVFCQPIVGQTEPTQVIMAITPKGLTVDATHVFSTTNGGKDDANIVSSDGSGSMFIRIADFAFELLRHGDELYWLTTDDKVHRVSMSTPEAQDDVAPTSGSTARRLLAAGDFVYVLTSIGIERFHLTTLQRDRSFVLPTGAVPLDFAVDEQGIYWLSGGLQTSEIGFYALSHEAPMP